MAEFAVSTISLRSRLESGRLGPAEALAIAAEAGRVLAQAHAAGRIHGNLTSASILLQATAPRVTIQGFGARVASGDVLEQLAPEQIAGGPPTIAADIFSFGRILDQI